MYVLAGQMYLFSYKNVLCFVLFFVTKNKKTLYISMLQITIPLTENNYCYLQKTHPESIVFTNKDELALIIGSMIKIGTLSKGKREEKINRSIYPCEREIGFSNNLFKRSGSAKLKISTVRTINNKIDRMMKRHLFRYIHLKKIIAPELMYKDCIQCFIDEFGLSETEKLFETLKKYDFRQRKKNGDSFSML